MALRQDPTDPIVQMRQSLGKPIHRLPKPPLSRQALKRKRQIRRLVVPAPKGTHTVPDALMINLSEIEDRRRLQTEETSRALQAAVVALRVKGLTQREIAQALTLSEPIIKRALFDARQANGLTDLDVLLDKRACILAVDGLIELLEAKDPQAIFETLRGRGLLRVHQSVKGDGESGAMTLNVNFSLPPGMERSRPILDGRIIGTPRLLPDVTPEEAPREAPTQTLQETDHGAP